MKDLFLYDEDSHNATKELDKVDLSEVLRWLTGHSPSSIKCRIAEEYPDLEYYLETLTEDEFMIYFENRYNAQFGVNMHYYMVNVEDKKV